MIGAVLTSIVMLHVDSTSLIITICLLLYFTLMHSYIIDHMYTHVNPRLLFKITKVNKELYLSSLVISPTKECKQDRIDLSFLLPLSLYIHTAWLLVWNTIHLLLVIGLFHPLWYTTR